jgi:hypothetical protein
MAKPRLTPLAPLLWPRSDPAELAAFDPRTKRCTMNCGPHRDDPRSQAERQLQCGDCVPTTAPEVASVPVALLHQALEALEHHREQTRPIERTELAIEALRQALDRVR